EWNYEVNAAIDPVSYQIFADTFDHLYDHEAYPLSHDIIVDYRRNYRTIETSGSDINQHFNKHRQKIDYPDEKNNTPAKDVHHKHKPTVIDLFRPNDAQTEALIELKRTRAAGNDKAIVVAATGVGKTMLAALDSRDYESVLFIAHREEILEQSINAFTRIRGSAELGRLYSGNRDTDKSVIFASVQTLTREQTLRRFLPDYFKYIIIDEFHHASAASYQRIIDYFRPDFLLGLTATPHRMDKKNIFEICDFNLVYDADLFSAINRGWLCPFKYFGIYDYTVNYNNITWINGKYLDKELESALSIGRRAELIYKHYMAHKRGKTLAFCSSISHADFMAEYFNKQGIKAVCVHSNSSSDYFMDRTEAIAKLASGQLEIIFSVEMLNEGVDIPAVDLLLLLRPTESPTVFLQQLGRGLRQSANKKDLKVLDFIGNYKRVDLLPFMLSRISDGKFSFVPGKPIDDQMILPLNCSVQFELEAVDILTQALQSRLQVRDKIAIIFRECGDSLGHCPTRSEFYNYLETDQYLQIKSQAGLNPFRDYNSFLQSIQMVSYPAGYLDSPAHRLIRTLETTSMTALYKIPCIRAFYHEGRFMTETSVYQIAQSFAEFYKNERNAGDLLNKKSRKNYKDWSITDYKKLAVQNPIKYLAKTHPDIFAYDSEFETFKIILDLNMWQGDPYFIRDFQDVL
ncbi:MAG: DEAD/DEAH box helicase, partial [Clostridiaceae bacterium]|nr:DEAD/DEAH box helicase [Clostridiaceae bacterium]